MLKFISSEFENKLSEAITNLKKRDQFKMFDGEDLLDPTMQDFSPEEYDDQVIGWEDEISIFLPKMDNEEFMTYRQFIDLAEEIDQIEMPNQKECWTNKRYLLRVEFFGDDGHKNLWKLTGKGKYEPPSSAFPIEMIWESFKYHCALVRGITPFAIAVVQSGNYEEFYPPILDGEFFVEVHCESQIVPEICRKMAEAYLFELSTTAGVDLSPTSRDTDYDSWDENAGDEEYDGSTWNKRLRPLLLGKGMAELISLYNTGVCAKDSSIQILFFTKVMEFVSQTVIRRKVTELGRLKLLSPRALDPDADYVWDLQNFFEEQRKYRSDQESIKLTVKECCDPIELKAKAPVFLDKLYAIGPNANPREKEEAMAQFGEALSVTRNMIVHAKSNYDMTGRECPLEQFSQFAICSRMAAEKAIRWFHFQHENMRIG